MRRFAVAVYVALVLGVFLGLTFLAAAIEGSRP